jgi:hypothetical protein
MPITFEGLLLSEKIEPKSVHLVRHQDKRWGGGRTPYWLWRTKPADFELYQRIQRRPVIQEGNLIASFVVPPTGETLFVGLYKVQGVGSAPDSMCDPLGDHSFSGLYLYDIIRDDGLSDYAGKLVIEWGQGFRSWVQRAHKVNKPIVELRREFKEPAFPGYLQFIRPLSEIEALPDGWTDRLREAKGVYLLTCPRTREQYVGSATGSGGFHERWLQHAAKGGDAVKFKSRDPSDYQISVLEVAGSGASDRDILHAEQLWIRKLQTTLMGLNGGSIQPEKASAA